MSTSATQNNNPQPAQNSEEELTNGIRMMVRALKDNGFDTIYGIVGIPVSAIAFWAQKEGMKYYGFRFEQQAAHAAAIAGYLTKKPGICLTVSGPGFLNGLTGIANANVNCFPVIQLGGSSTRSIEDLQQGDYEGIDQMNVAKPFVKESYRIDHVEDIPIGVARAIRAASSGRPGAVYLDMTTAMLGNQVPKSQVESLFFKVSDPAPAVVPSTESVDHLLQLLSQAKHPLIIFGKGAAYAQADEDIKTFVETTGIPFLPMSMAKGLLPDNHPQCAASSRSLALENADMILLVGARLNWLLDFGKGKHWNQKALLGQIEIDPIEIDNTRPIDAPVVGDIVSAMKLILSEMPKYNIKPSSDWLEMIQKHNADSDAKFNALLQAPSYPLNYHTTLGVIKKVLDNYKDIILVNEGANTLDDTRDAIDRFFPRTRLDCGTWSPMGIGMGYAIGAATATGKQVIAIEGDSAFGFSGMDVGTICRYNLPITVVVFNNGGIYKGDAVNPSGGPEPSPYTLDADAKYNMIMEAFGGAGYDVDKAEDLEKALTEALASKKPAMINVKIDIHAGKESGHIGYLNPPLLPGITC